jgi:membrane-associated PAP2 superfamily phosphatase
MFKSFFSINIVVPGIAFLMAIFSEYSGLDLWLAHHFYDQKLDLWPYRNSWLTEVLLHRGGRYLVVGMAVTLVGLFIGTFFRPGLKSYRKDFAYILVAGISGPAIVGFLKSITHIYTPWALHIFGGTQPYIRIFDHVPGKLPVGHAFPAAHASGGFAWFSVFFALRRRAVPWYRLSLALPLALGVFFGAAQQARGAHFLSHDLAALGVCWLCAALWSQAFYANAAHRRNIEGLQSPRSTGSAGT